MASKNGEKNSQNFLKEEDHFVWEISEQSRKKQAAGTHFQSTGKSFTFRIFFIQNITIRNFRKLGDR